MNDDRIVTIAQMEAFTNAAHGLNFVGLTREQKYKWLEKVLSRFWYATARKRNRSAIKAYAMKMTGYSDAQMTRLIRAMMDLKRIPPPKRGERSSFPARYTVGDVALLVVTDNAHGRLSGAATREIFRRECDVFGRGEYARLKGISVSHLYNLRGRRQYASQAATFRRTNPSPVRIGERRKPSPGGKPGYIRVDSVHQGDRDGEKGVYHVNLVDEVTQWEVVGAVEGISERFLAPLLEELLRSFPFAVVEFHSDNGSEYVNAVVAAMLGRMLIGQTKSRPRRSNDNALVEGKNGSVIRKHMGYAHIPGRHAPGVDAFYRAHFNAYVNFHRPSGYATTTVDRRGKERKVYRLYETPYDHFRKLPGAAAYLREGVTFAELDRVAHAMSDNECAILMQKAKRELFNSFRNSPA